MKNHLSPAQASQNNSLIAHLSARGRSCITLLPRVLFLLCLLLISSAGMLQGSASAHSRPRPPHFPTLPRINGAPVKAATWYFADGQVGAGFQEFLTLSNADPSTDCTVKVSYLNQGSPSAQAIAPLLDKIVLVPHSSRVTLSVNANLGIPQQQQPGLLLSAIVAAMTACPTLVVERPMYFTFEGIKSGTDVMGVNTPDTTFYFADVPTRHGTTSFVDSRLSILNPSGYSSTITATYYAAGHQVGTQSVTVPGGARGTIYPGNLLTYPYNQLPNHVTARVTATVPVVIERPSSMSQQNQGNAGVVSGAVSVVGSTLLSTDWLFAEGYTGGQYQENLVIANPTPMAAMATITLEYQNAHTQMVTRQVGAESLIIVDVNQLNAHPTGTCDGACAPTPSVSAEVTATGSALVVERQMFFRYHMAAPAHQSVTALGWTDVTGQMAPAVTTAQFAEGDINPNYEEWLVLQNPTSQSEDLTVTLFNAVRHSAQQGFTLPAHSRTTVSINALARSTHLVGENENSQAYELSLLVQGQQGAIFVAERPLYFNTGTADVQGGTDVLGYSIPLKLVFPWDITRGPDDNLWFTEYFGNSIDKLNPRTRVITQYRAGLTADSGPNYITTGPDGNLWFTQFAAGQIGKLDPATGAITEYGLPGGSHPQDIATGPDGNLWFADDGLNTIGKITPSGVVSEYSAGLSAGADPNGIITGPDGNLWFTEDDNHAIGRINPTTHAITEFHLSADARPELITTGADGNLWFTDDARPTGKIGTINPTTHTITEYSAGMTPGAYPADITQGSDGNLWFTDSGTYQIGTINPRTHLITESNLYMLGNSASWGITTGPDGNLWFTDYGANRIGMVPVTPAP